MDVSSDAEKRIPIVSRNTLRLTMKVSADRCELLSLERLPMITPPQPGACPVAGTHGGHWMELLDQKGRVLAHRLLDPTLLDSVEVHSPDGRIERVFGGTRTGIVEVLLPDLDGATEAVLMGHPRGAGEREGSQKATGEITRFKLNSDAQGGRQ